MEGFTLGKEDGRREHNRVVVTGAAGFIASHLVNALLERGHEVVAVDRRSVTDDQIAAANLVDAIAHHAFRLHSIDLVTGSLDELVEGAETVFHLAAAPGVRHSWGRRFGDYVASNIVATQRLLTACERRGVRRLVLASSSSVYGTATGPSRETDLTGPMSPYGVTKLAAEHLCLAHAGRQDMSMSVAVLRYFTVYGPRQRPGMAFNRILLGALTGRSVPLYGDGRQRRAFTYVDDIVAATLTAASARLAAGAVINVGGGSSATVLEVLQLVQDVTGRVVRIQSADPQPGDVGATDADLTLARRVLGYEPRVGLRDGIARQAEWLGGLPEPARMSRYASEMEVTA